MVMVGNVIDPLPDGWREVHLELPELGLVAVGVVVDAVAAPQEDGSI